MNILITAASTTHAYKLYRHLSPQSDKVYFADCQDLPQIKSLEKEFVKIPEGNSPSFAHSLLTICLDHNIEKVYPLRRGEVLALSEAIRLFEEYGITLIVPNRHQLPDYIERNNTGEIILKEETAPELGKGIFIKTELSPELKLFIVD